MFSTIISIIATMLGVVTIFMAYLVTFRNKDLTEQLERADNRATNLRDQIETFRTKTIQEKQNLQHEIAVLKGEETSMPATDNTVIDPNEPLYIQEIEPAELKARLDNGDEVVIVDMRQSFEYQAGHISGAINIFVQDLMDEADELPKDKDIVFQCWHGNSSLQASAYLIENGWAANRVASLSGGIAGWIQSQGMDSLVKE